MSWRVVTVSSNAKLDYKMGYLVVRTAESAKRIHLSEISVLLIESTAVALTAYLLCELSKEKVAVIFCDEKRCPIGSFVPYYGSHDTSLKIKNQTQWDKDVKAFVWAEIVRAKIRGQIAVLEENGRDGAELLKGYLTEIQPADTTNREGHAAKVYFNALFGMDFSRSQDCNTNARSTTATAFFCRRFAGKSLQTAISPSSASFMTTCSTPTTLPVISWNRFVHSLITPCAKAISPFLNTRRRWSW